MLMAENSAHSHQNNVRKNTHSDHWEIRPLHFGYPFPNFAGQLKTFLNTFISCPLIPSLVSSERHRNFQWQPWYQYFANRLLAHSLQKANEVPTSLSSARVFFVETCNAMRWWMSRYAEFCYKSQFSAIFVLLWNSRWLLHGLVELWINLN